MTQAALRRIDAPPELPGGVASAPSPRSSDGFDVLRVAAAGAVIVNHAFLFSGHNDPLLALLGQTSLGNVAVWVFFAISGYLVMGSLARDPHPGRFLARRALRLLPGLAVAVMAATFVIGPLVTSLTPTQYLTRPATWWYPVSNILLLPQQTTLPGVFRSNYRSDVIGSLWTLPYEALMYLSLVLLAVMLGRRCWRIGPVAVVLSVVVWQRLISPAGDVTIMAINVYSASVFAGFFFSGAALHVLRHRIPMSGRLAAACLASTVITWPTSTGIEVAMFTVPYLVVWCGRRTSGRWSRPLTRFGDISYGLYLYGFLAEQVVAAILGGHPPLVAMLPGSLLLSVPLAVLSWRLVEKPALAHKPRRPMAGGGR
jgi:peptidoglycan/LPS O-acetylase OafA/YrhL